MKNKLLKSEVLLPILIFLILSVTLIYVWKYFASQKTHEITLRTELTAKQVATHFEEHFKAHLEIVKFLRREWLVNNINSPMEFEKAVLPLMKSFPGFQAINYIDPTGVIRWVNPEATNIEAKDKDLHDHPFAAETFILAENTGVDCATPVIELWQGGLGIATYFPLIREGRLEGYLNGVFRVNDFIQYYFKHGINQNFCLHIKDDDLEFYCFGDEIVDHDHYLSNDYTLSILNREWTVSLSPRPKLFGATTSYINLLFLILSIVLPGAFAYVIRLLIIRRQELLSSYRLVQESETQYRQLVDDLPEGVAIHQDGIFVFVNKAGVDLLKAKGPEDLIGKPILNVVHPDNRQQVVERIQKLLVHSGEVPTIDEKFLRFDGKIIDVEVAARRIQYNGLPSVQVIVRDVSEGKYNEKLQSVLYEISKSVSTTANLDELYQAIHNQLTKVIDTTNFFIALIDAKQNVMSFPYFIDEYDNPPEPVELTKKTISEYVIQTGMPLYFKEKDIRELANMGMIDMDYAGTISKVWLGSPLWLENKSIGVIVVQSYHDPDLYPESDLDILNFVSEQIAIAIARKQVDEFTKEAEKKYRLLSEQLTEANNLKEILLDTITHDLKNPAGVISNMAEMLLEEHSDDEILKIIKDSSDKLLQVMDNATTIAQVTLGDKIKLEELDLAEVLHSVGKEFSSQLKQSEMTFEIDIPDKLLIKANPIISEVFSNYISNAVKYASAGKKILIDSRKGDGFLTINVKDFGTAIPENKRYEVFYRGVQLEDGKEHGRGLGLSIVKRIAEAHNAEVGVKPNKPKGNIFFMKIPI